MYLKRYLFSTFRVSVHTNPADSRKRSFLKTLFKLKEFENASLASRVNEEYFGYRAFQRNSRHADLFKSTKQRLSSHDNLTRCLTSLLYMVKDNFLSKIPGLYRRSSHLIEIYKHWLRNQLSQYCLLSSLFNNATPTTWQHERTIWRFYFKLPRPDANTWHDVIWHRPFPHSNRPCCWFQVRKK